MRLIAAQLFALIGVPVILSASAEAFECRVCHSKNPAMVRMHTAVREKGIGCFDCHRVGGTLMGKDPRKGQGAQLLRRQSELVCAQCHRPEPVAKKQE